MRKSNHVIRLLLWEKQYTHAKSFKNSLISLFALVFIQIFSAHSVFSLFYYTFCLNLKVYLFRYAKTVFFICHIEIYYFYVRKVYDFKKFKPLTSSASTLERKKIMQGALPPPPPLISTLTVRPKVFSIDWSVMIGWTKPILHKSVMKLYLPKTDWKSSVTWLQPTFRAF